MEDMAADTPEAASKVLVGNKYPGTVAVAVEVGKDEPPNPTAMSRHTAVVSCAATNPHMSIAPMMTAAATIGTDNAEIISPIS